MYKKYEEMIKFIRDGLEESSHFGTLVHLNKTKILRSIGDISEKYYQRSCSKPLQFSTLISRNINFDFSQEEIAVCCASHTGTKLHQSYIRNVLSKADMSENSLLCPPDLPLDKDEQNYLIKNNLKPLKIHNNCSGKHSAMLALCRAEKFDFSSYNELSHPVSKLVISQICNLCETNHNEIVISKDGCTLPTVATTLTQLGKGFLNLLLTEKYQSIRNSILKYPYFAGGNRRIDSEIINAGNGNLIAKVGAGGIIVVVNLSMEEALVIKIADANYLARSLVITKAMLDLGWINTEQINSTPLKNLCDTSIRTETGEIIGNAEFCFSL